MEPFDFNSDGLTDFAFAHFESERSYAQRSLEVAISTGISFEVRSFLGFSNIRNTPISSTEILGDKEIFLVTTDIIGKPVSQMSINILADVNTTGVGNGQALIWDGTNWVPGSPVIGATGFANTSNIANIVLSLNGLTTSNLAEGSNLYFPNSLMFEVVKSETLEIGRASCRERV